MNRYDVDEEGYSYPHSDGDWVKFEDVQRMMSPRFWKQAQNEAWHKNIPDVQKAFEELLKATMNMEV